MVSFEEKTWFTGAGLKVKFEDLVRKIKFDVGRGAAIFIGSDSFISRDKINFTSAICLYAEGVSACYFFTKDCVSLKSFKALVSRITEEVRRTVELADYFYSQENISPGLIEVHIDVSPFGSKAATSNFSEMLQGYVTGAGYSCKVKPDAWASQSVADKHSK